MATKSPAFDAELFSVEALRDPYPLYKQMRDAGPQVWLENHDMWAVSRYEDVREALRADSVLVSGEGVAMNDALNHQQSYNSLISDGDMHRKYRSPIIKPMLPGALRDVRETVQRKANELIDRLLATETFDGVTDLAEYLPVEIVIELIGLPEGTRPRMLEWARASFDALGPMNERGQAGIATLMGASEYMVGIGREDLDPGGWAASLFTLVDEGHLEFTEAQRLIFDFVIPSLDTTVLSSGHLLYQLGTNADQYDLVRNDPSLVPSAVQEAIRIGTPIRAFTRYASEDYEAGEVSIPKGDRVAIFYAAANHDERHYDNPATFDVTRNPKDHLSFGFGAHRCAGAHLAALEMESLLNAMVEKVSTITVGETTPFISNMLAGYGSFETSFA